MWKCSMKFAEQAFTRKGDKRVLCAPQFAPDDALSAKKESYTGYKNQEWISLQKLSSAHSLGDVRVKTTAVYSSLAWVSFSSPCLCPTIFCLL